MVVLDGNWLYDEISLHEICQLMKFHACTSVLVVTLYATLVVLQRDVIQ